MDSCEVTARLRYDIEADFLLLTTCNFRCDYCYLSDESLGAKITTYATNAEWQDAFDATGKTWLAHDKRRRAVYLSRLCRPVPPTILDALSVHQRRTCRTARSTNLLKRSPPNAFTSSTRPCITSSERRSKPDVFI